MKWNFVDSLMKISHIGIVNNSSCIYMFNLCTLFRPESQVSIVVVLQNHTKMEARTSCFSIFSNTFNLLRVFHVAEVTSLLEELRMMVPTIELVIMGHIIWRTNHTTSMATFETRPVVRSAINRHLWNSSNHISIYIDIPRFPLIATP